MAKSVKIIHRAMILFGVQASNQLFSQITLQWKKLDPVPFIVVYHYKSIIILDSVTIIGLFVFSECLSLHKIIIPDSVTNIGQWAFGDCINLRIVFVCNSSLQAFGDGIFHSYRSLQFINIPHSITALGAHTFYNCNSLQVISLPS